MYLNTISHALFGESHFSFVCVHPGAAALHSVVLDRPLSLLTPPFNFERAKASDFSLPQQHHDSWHKYQPFLQLGSCLSELGLSTRGVGERHKTRGLRHLQHGDKDAARKDALTKVFWEKIQERENKTDALN